MLACSERMPDGADHRMEYHHRSGSYYILENPSGSLLFELPCIKATPVESMHQKCAHLVQFKSMSYKARLKDHNATSINVCLGALGAPSRKCVAGPCNLIDGKLRYTPPMLLRLPYGELLPSLVNSTSNLQGHGGLRIKH